MKKFSVFFLLITICIVLSGCSNSNESDISEYVITKSAIDIPPLYPENDEYHVYLHMCAYNDALKYDPEIYDSFEIYDEMYIYVDGVKTKLTYSEKYTDENNRISVVEYFDENGNEYGFELDGRLFYYHAKDEHPHDCTGTISAEDAVRYAAEFAAKASDKFDVSKLTVKWSEDSTCRRNIFFSNSIDEHSVPGNYEMTVNCEGKIIHYLSADDPYDGLDISGIDFDLALELVKAKLDDFYQDRTEKGVYDIPECDSWTVRVSVDGRFVISCNVIVRFYCSSEVVCMTVICPGSVVSNQSQIETTS